MSSVGHTSWNGLAKSFHWLVVILIFVAATLGLMSENAEMSPGKLQLFVWHKSVGITVLGVMILRLVWKLVCKSPDKLNELSESNQKLSQLGHWFIYAIAILLPLSGWILTSAANFPFQWFGLFDVPLLFGENAPLKENASLAHFCLFYILLVLVIGHVGMATKHHLSGVLVLQRILPKNLGVAPVLVIVFTLSAAWVALAWTNSYSNNSVPSASIDTDAANKNIAELVAVQTEQFDVDEMDDWEMLSDQSSLGFIGTYAEVDFDGGFSRFKSRIVFDPDQFEHSLFDVSIDVTSISTGSTDRDSSVHEEAWFDFASFPESTYQATSFELLESGEFIAHGILNLKGVEQPVDLQFTWLVVDERHAKLMGEALVNRLDFGIGSGSWANDPTVGFDVRIVVNLLLGKAN